MAVSQDSSGQAAIDGAVTEAIANLVNGSPVTISTPSVDSLLLAVALWPNDDDIPYDGGGHFVFSVAFFVGGNRAASIRFSSQKFGGSGGVGPDANREITFSLPIFVPAGTSVSVQSSLTAGSSGTNSWYGMARLAPVSSMRSV